ncbi:hypothetical protein [Roseovarius sp. D0-M9]|uniref:hypothetical protein n=1 Tax=Roseovarius sp. D0-M9 TaxID=3127117 RepID=UPI0030103911
MAITQEGGWFVISQVSFAQIFLKESVSVSVIYAIGLRIGDWRLTKFDGTVVEGIKIAPRSGIAIDSASIYQWLTAAIACFFHKPK